LPTSHPGLLLASPRTINLELLSRNFDDLATLTGQRREAELMALVHRLVPEFGGTGEATGTAVAAS
jgi:hypothetical protein